MVEIIGVDVVQTRSDPDDPETERLAVRIRTDAGVNGCYVGFKSYGFDQVTSCAPWLVGGDPLHRERIWSECKRELRKYDRVGQSYLDLALWDFAGRYHDEPVHRLLGSYRERLPAYLSVAARADDRTDDLPERCAERAAEAAANGYSAVKLRFSRSDVRTAGAPTDPDLVVASIEAVDSRVGDRVDLMVDTTAELETYADALAVGRACDRVDALWFEDPFKDGSQSHHAHRTLAADLDTPLLLTELTRGVEAHTDFALADATDILRADPFYDAGITGAVKIARVAEGLGLDVEFHAGRPECRHCMAATRNTNYLELPIDISSDPGWRYDQVDEDGTVPVPDAPGLEGDVDWAAIEADAVTVRRYE
jgi:L-alanine-DL-glutamate epimerase-like enolase superfamily enzyme